jgi:hypothetical protein
MFNKTIRQFWVMALILTMVLSFTGCSKADPEVKINDETKANESAVTTTKDIIEPIAESPILITSAGQSADFEIVKTLMDKVGIGYESNGTVKAVDLGDFKTLVIAVGGSSKGLGAAGINPDDEILRVREVIAKAKEKGMVIVALHTGGEGRRGTLSDRFVNEVLPQANYIVAVSTGNMDGLFSDIATSNDIPMASVDTIADVIGVLLKTFK